MKNGKLIYCLVVELFSTHGYFFVHSHNDINKEVDDLYLPRSPCVHSAAWMKCDGVPVDTNEDDKRWATIPDLPVE